MSAGWQEKREGIIKGYIKRAWNAEPHFIPIEGERFEFEAGNRNTASTTVYSVTGDGTETLVDLIADVMPGNYWPQNSSTAGHQNPDTTSTASTPSTVPVSKPKKVTIKSARARKLRQDVPARDDITNRPAPRKPRCPSHKQEMVFDPERNVWRCEVSGCPKVAFPKQPDTPQWKASMKLVTGALSLVVDEVSRTVLLRTEQNHLIDITGYIENGFDGTLHRIQRRENVGSSRSSFLLDNLPYSITKENT